MTDINEATKHATEQEAMIKQTQNDGEQLSTMLQNKTLEWKRSMDANEAKVTQLGESAESMQRLYDNLREGIDKGTAKNDEVSERTAGGFGSQTEVV